MGIVKRLWRKKSCLGPDERSFVAQYLDEVGRFLFYQMNPMDQWHALDVAQILLTQVSQVSITHLDIIVKAALLHDLGKVDKELTFWSRIAAGLLRRVSPKLRDYFAARTMRRNFWEEIRYGLYVDAVHPSRGAYMARSFGMEEMIVRLIRNHHDRPFTGQPQELTWLQRADNKS